MFGEYLRAHNQVYIPYIFMEWQGVKVNYHNNCPQLDVFVASIYRNHYVAYNLPEYYEKMEIEMTLQEVARADLNTCNDLLWIHKDALPL